MSERDFIFVGARPLPNDIIREVAQRHGLTFDDLLSQSRVRPLAHARQEAMWELRQRTRLSYPQIARRLNRTDHTTALQGARRHAQRMAEAKQGGKA